MTSSELPRSPIQFPSKTWYQVVAFFMALYFIGLPSSNAVLSLVWNFVFFFSAGYAVYLGISHSKVWDHFKLPPVDRILGVIMIAWLIPTLISYQNTHLMKAIFNLKWIPGLYAIVFLLRVLGHRFNLKKWIHGSLIVAGLSGLYGTWQSLTGIELIRPGRQSLHPIENLFRATGFFSGSLTFSTFMGAFSLIGFGLFYRQWRLTKQIKPHIWLLIVGLSSMSGLFFSFSRGAFLGYCITLILMTLIASRKLFISMILLGSILIGTLYYKSPAFHNRVHSVRNYQADTSARIRLDLWESALMMFKDRPLLGSGLGTFRHELPAYYARIKPHDPTFISHAHNLYLHILAETGLFGFISFLILLGIMLFLNWRLYRSANEAWESGLYFGLLSAQVFFLLNSVIEVTFFDMEINHLMNLLWAIILFKALPAQTSNRLSTPAS